LEVGICEENCLGDSNVHSATELVYLVKSQCHELRQGTETVTLHHRWHQSSPISHEKVDLLADVVDQCRKKDGMESEQQASLVDEYGMEYIEILSLQQKSPSAYDSQARTYQICRLQHRSTAVCVPFSALH